MRVLGASVEDVDFHPTAGETRDVLAIDAVTRQEIRAFGCEVKDGLWAGWSLSLRESQGRRLRLPVKLVDTGLTCRTEGYTPAHVRWDGGPLTIELAREEPR